MSYFDELKNSISDLFWSAVGDSHNEDEIKEMLDGIDFHALAQAPIHREEIVYEYAVNCALPLAMNYRGEELFPRATLLYEDIVDCMLSSVCCYRALEVWLLRDATIAVVANFHTEVCDGLFTTEYRIFKTDDCFECDLEIDPKELVRHLNEMCQAYHAHAQPIYEL